MKRKEAIRHTIYQNGVWSYRGVVYGSLREAVASAYYSFGFTPGFDI